MLYTSYSRGYKAGGFNLDRSALGSPIFAPADPRQSGGRGAGFNTANLQFDPETVNAWEVGFKWTRRNFILNVAAFRQRFEQFPAEHVQRLGLPGPEHQRLRHRPRHDDRTADASAATGACAAAASPRAWFRHGVEIEMAIYPARNLQFTAGFTYANTHYRNDLVGRDTGTPLDPALFLLPGDNLSNAPRIYGDRVGDLDAADRQ